MTTQFTWALFGLWWPINEVLKFSVNSRSLPWKQAFAKWLEHQCRCTCCSYGGRQLASVLMLVRCCVVIHWWRHTLIVTVAADRIHDADLVKFILFCKISNKSCRATESFAFQKQKYLITCAPVTCYWCTRKKRHKKSNAKSLIQIYYVTHRRATTNVCVLPLNANGSNFKPAAQLYTD